MGERPVLVADGRPGGGMIHDGLLPAEYILPLRWTEDSGLSELAGYLGKLVTWIPVAVVDGSPSALFKRHREHFPPGIRHIRPAAGPAHGNGKVAAVLTGVRSARAELLILADDDVRYTQKSLAAVVHHLGSADVVRPQNYFDPLPWHAAWDTSRTLINRAWSADFPGTLGLRRSALLATGGYEPVLFENLELIRTIRAAGGREKILPDVFIARRPPSARHFLTQRVRQAYDDFAQPARLLVELALLPAVLSAMLLPAGVRRIIFPALAVAAVAVAELGRQRHHGTAAFPPRTAWFAPLWVLERAACVWVALCFRLRGGVHYAGTRIATAAHSTSGLRRHHGGKLPGPGAAVAAPTMPRAGHGAGPERNACESGPA
ncbi:glycosyltransferase [Pseudarthrobacter enclensis]|uniref:glycosyltransferase n=1 Tax=Pseudarthrobacter enclensis TaxID=993070 RepID=UPI003EE3D07F